MSAAIRTTLTTLDGLRIYDLEPEGGALLACAGPDGYAPAAIDPEDLPAGFRWLEDDEWEDACAREARQSQEDRDEYGDLHDYHSGEYLRPATEAERDASRAAGPEGVILIGDDDELMRPDDRGADDARRCYVQE